MLMTRKNWLDLALALTLAVVAWFSVNGQEKVDTWVDVRVDFKGIPQNLFVSDGLVNKISLRIRGTRGLISNLTNQDNYLTVDLKNIVKGENIIPIDQSSLPIKGALEVVEINPSNIELMVDVINKEERKISLQILGSPPQHMEFETLNLTPKVLVLKGPETILNDIKDVKVPIQVGSFTKEGTFSITGTPVLPPSVESIPPQVNVDIIVRPTTENMTLKLEPKIVLPESFNGQTNQKNVSVTIKVPKAKLNSPELEAIKAVVVPADTLSSTVKASIAVTVQLEGLPEWAEVVKIVPEKIFVNIKKSPQELPTLSNEVAE